MFAPWFVSMAGQTDDDIIMTDLTTLLPKLLELRKQWLALQPLAERNHAALWRWFRINFSYQSNHFEGNTLTYSETQLLLIYGATRGDHYIREYDEMKAHNVAFEYVQKCAADEDIIREKDIRDINLICLKEPFYSPARTADGQETYKKIFPGEYKTTPNHVLTKEGHIHHFASPEETPAKMAELTKWMQDWLSQTEDKKLAGMVAFLAEFHNRFINIHPFDDGNGRTVRLLMNYVLLREGFLPMVLDNREKYIDAIQKYDADITEPLETLFAANLCAMLEKGIHAAAEEITLNGKPGLAM